MNARVTLVRFKPPYHEWDEIFTLEFGKSLFDISISHDGKYLSAIISDVAGDQRLVLYEISKLLQGNTSYKVVYEFGDSPASQFVFSDDDQYLVGSSFYTGVSNIFRVNIESGDFEMLSNT